MGRRTSAGQPDVQSENGDWPRTKGGQQLEKWKTQLLFKAEGRLHRLLFVVVVAAFRSTFPARMIQAWDLRGNHLCVNDLLRLFRRPFDSFCGVHAVYECRIIFVAADEILRGNRLALTIAVRAPQSLFNFLAIAGDIDVQIPIEALQIESLFVGGNAGDHCSVSRLECDL